MTKFALISCSKSKKDGIQLARNLYEPSPIFRERKKLVTEKGYSWGILSAKYGYLNPWEQIKTYDMHIKERKGIIWGTFLKQKLLNRLEYEDVDEVMILAGKKYVNPIQPFLEVNGYRVNDYNKGLQSGERLHQLKEENKVGTQVQLNEF